VPLSHAALPVHLLSLKYGRYDKLGWGHGVRDVLFPTSSTEHDKANRVETWIRLEDGERRANLVLSGA
jgi:hypothetical protein